MSKPPEDEPQQLRQTRLSELEASQQVMSELSDEELEVIAGGALKQSLSPPGQLERTSFSAKTIASTPVFLRRWHDDWEKLRVIRVAG